jgi:hypothetical protein
VSGKVWLLREIEFDDLPEKRAVKNNLVSSVQSASQESWTFRENLSLVWLTQFVIQLPWLMSNPTLLTFTSLH